MGCTASLPLPSGPRKPSSAPTTKADPTTLDKPAKTSPLASTSVLTRTSSPEIDPPSQTTAKPTPTPTPTTSTTPPAVAIPATPGAPRSAEASTDDADSDATDETPRPHPHPLPRPETDPAAPAQIPNAGADWPARAGAIDLSVQDLPHASAATEWWYYNAHVTGTTASGESKRLSFFTSFFRVVKHVDEKGNRQYGHAVTWAVTDADAKECYIDVALEPDAPSDFLHGFENGDTAGPSDPFLRRAMLDVLRKGRMPRPDRVMPAAAQVSTSSLSLNYHGSTLTKDGDAYVVTCADETGAMTASLRFVPEKPATRHGDHGIVKGHEGAGEEMFYYFIPRCSVTGTIVAPILTCDKDLAHDARRVPTTFAVQGSGWYDHEFGGLVMTSEQRKAMRPAGVTEASMEYAWNWIAAQLDDGTDVTSAVLVNPKTKQVLETKIILVAKDGTRSQFDETSGAHFQEVRSEPVWTSVRTFRNYPTVFSVRVDAAELDLTVTVAFPDQEVVTMLAMPGFWEGRCDVAGTYQGRPVSGLAYLERNGFDSDMDLNTFFKNVGKCTRDWVAKSYPLEPTFDEAVRLCATKDTEHYMQDVPLPILGKYLMGPMRLITDRGGKSWRSYAVLACIDAVGGDCRKYAQWLAFAEFLHGGSLLVDDVQDKSLTRRGGPAAHIVFGEPIAINAGTGAYFMWESLMDVPEIGISTRVKCYQLFFAAMRGGHAGQCLDLVGNDYLMDDVVQTGDASLLEKRILAIHRLKTAVPAGTLARLGATVGGGTEAQIEAVGLYMEAVGVAFQIMDDVLNLRGVVAKTSDKLKAGTLLKTLGEDIMEGKITYPVAKYMGKVREEDKRRKLWEVVKSKPQDQAVVNEVIAELESVGAVEDCVADATRIVNEAWDQLDREIPESTSKIMLRCWGWYVCEQLA